MTGDYSINAGGLDVTAAIAFTAVASVVVVASAITTVVVVVDACAATSVIVVTFFLKVGGPSFMDYLGLPFFFVGMVPRLQL